jgi:hypothetical protein
MKQTDGPGPNGRSKGRLLRRALFWGAVSVGMYLLVFLNQDAVTQHFTKGGIFALVVVLTALAFSLIHGSFANYLLDLSGIRPLQEKKED